MVAIIVPAGLWDEAETAVIGSWLYADGDHVAEGTNIVDLMVGKSSYELAAPASGRLRIAVAEESEVHPGDTVGNIDP